MPTPQISGLLMPAPSTWMNRNSFLSGTSQRQ